MTAPPINLAQLREWADDRNNTMVPIHASILLALLDAVEAAQTLIVTAGEGDPDTGYAEVVDPDAIAKLRQALIKFTFEQP